MIIHVLYWCVCMLVSLVTCMFVPGCRTWSHHPPQRHLPDGWRRCDAQRVGDVKAGERSGVPWGLGLGPHIRQQGRGTDPRGSMGSQHSRLQSFARPPPRIAKGDEKVIRHADRRPPWTASLPVAKKRSYLINCTLSITHEVVYPKKNTHLIIHTNLVHFQMV